VSIGGAGRERDKGYDAETIAIHYSKYFNYRTTNKTLMNFEKAFKFLKDLGKNNDRAWFEKNKPRYNECKEEFEEFVSVLLNDMIQFDASLAGLNPKKLIFRIYRDVRFSKDKR
jgi:uncharacterized protein (DUF2461 family)